MTGDDSLPDAAPAFASHFTDPLYDDPASELAPFGTDEGWDMLHEWAERREGLTAATTVRDLLAGSGFEGIEEQLDVPERSTIPQPGGQIDAAVITIGAGFTLLRLTGRIDAEGKALTLKALDVLIDRFDSAPELVRQRADLQSFTG